LAANDFWGLNLDLKESTVFRKLDAKLKIGGMEAPDLLGVLIFASVMNLFFGRSSFAFVFVICLPLLLLIGIYFGKRGKPDGYMVHLARYYLTAGYHSAGLGQKNAEIILTRKIYKND
jgi:hypothetical protein